MNLDDFLLYTSIEVFSETKNKQMDFKRTLQFTEN